MTLNYEGHGKRGFMDLNRLFCSRCLCLDASVVSCT